MGQCFSCLSCTDNDSKSKTKSDNEKPTHSKETGKLSIVSTEEIEFTASPSEEASIRTQETYKFQGGMDKSKWSLIGNVSTFEADLEDLPKSSKK